MVGRFQSSPKETHALAIKRIFRYLKGIVELGLWYLRDGKFSFIAYSNANWDGSMDYQKSNTNCSFFLGNCLVAWLSKKQASISLSTTEVEYIATIECYT